MRIVVTNGTRPAHRKVVLEAVRSLRIAIVRHDVSDMASITSLVDAINGIYKEDVRDIFDMRRFFRMSKEEVAEACICNPLTIIPYLKEVELELELSLR